MTLTYIKLPPLGNIWIICPQNGHTFGLFPATFTPAKEKNQSISMSNKNAFFTQIPQTTKNAKQQKTSNDLKIAKLLSDAA